jgi:predicted kinase
MHTVDGAYKDYRILKHDEIIDDLMCGKIGIEKPSSILLGGGSAAGKSRSSRILLKLDSVTDTSEKVTVVDCDKIKEMLPEHPYFVEQYPDDWSVYLHDESSHISDKVIQRCVETRRDFIYDGTMKNIEKYEKLIKQLQSEHYTVSAMVFDVPIETALKRNKDRQLLEGRLVPEHLVIETHIEVSRAFQKLKDLVDEFVLYDNQMEFPEIISLRMINGEELVRNQERLREFLEKSSVVFSDVGKKLVICAH